MNPAAITIVSGLPRSGTSLLMQMLAAGGIPPLTDGLREPDEDNPRGYFEFRPVLALKTDKTWLPQAQGRAVKLVHVLLPELPADYSYSILWSRRALAEVLLSQRRMLERHGKAGAALPDSALARVFERQLAQVEQWMERQPHFRFLPVWHHEVLADPGGQAARINEFMGGQLDPSAMARAVDPALKDIKP